VKPQIKIKSYINKKHEYLIPVRRLGLMELSTVRPEM